MKFPNFEKFETEVSSEKQYLLEMSWRPFEYLKPVQFPGKFHTPASFQKTYRQKNPAKFDNILLRALTHFSLVFPIYIT